MLQINKRYAQEFSQKDEYLAPDVVVEPVPAPTGGWDALSPISNMEPKYAFALTNWVPRPGWLEMRGGYNAWSQNLNSNSPVNTLMTYRPPGGIEKLFAASGGFIYDVSLNGVYTTSFSGNQSDQWQYVNFTPSGGASYLYLVNGIDSPLAWNGTSWSNPAITGVNPINLVHINVFKRRLWFTQINSTSVWFLGTDAIQGAATQLDLGAFMTKGGFLMAMASWTVDGGNGPDDLAVFISSKGQCVIYKGTDPTNANAWALVGVFDLPPPIGRRCFRRLGADTLLITTQGVLPLSQALPFDPVASRSVAITNRIQNAMVQAAQLYSGNFGWQLQPFDQQTLLILNIPQITASAQVQYVMNTLTGAWAQFTGWNANCFELFNESLFFGDNKGNVNLAYAGGLDLVSPILGDLKCAFNYFKQPGRLKNATMLRPFLVADGSLTPTIQVDADFADSSPAAPVSILQPSGAIWDTSLWDQATWSSGVVTVINWLSVTAVGTALAIRMTINLQGGGLSASIAASSIFDTGLFDTMVFDGNGAVLASGLGVPTLKVNFFELALQYGSPV